MKTALTLVTCLSITALATDASAGPNPTLSGWATRDWTTFHSSFMGNLELQPNGEITGHLTIITNNDNEPQTFCRYLRFKQNRVERNSWNFDAFGVCLNEKSGGYYAVSNRVVLIDYGTPGAGVDYVDINYYGPVGVSVPGGYINTGDWIFQP